MHGKTCDRWKISGGSLCQKSILKKKEKKNWKTQQAVTYFTKKFYFKNIW